MNVLDSSIELIRTDPIGFAGVGIGTHLATNSLMVDQGSSVPEIMASSGLLLAVASLKHIFELVSFRERLEDKISRIGFEPRLLAKTTGEWCTRQAAVVACEKFDKKSEYALLVKKENGSFSWLPHI